MRYYYRFHEVPDKDPSQYYETEEIAKIPLYPATPELDAEWNANDDRSDLWVVHDPDGWSWEAKEYDREDEARLDLVVSLNMSVYEYIHDI